MFKEAFNSWRIVFSKFYYILIAIIVAIVFYLLNGLLFTYPTIYSSYSLITFSAWSKLTLTLLADFWQTLLPSVFLGLIILSILTGMLVSILLYRYNVLKSTLPSYSFFGALGIFLGVLAPGCVSCGLGIAAVLGFSSVFASLPFQGGEVLWIAVIIMIFSTVHVSKNLFVCKPLNRKSVKKSNE